MNHPRTWIWNDGDLSRLPQPLRRIRLQRSVTLDCPPDDLALRLATLCPQAGTRLALSPDEPWAVRTLPAVLDPDHDIRSAWLPTLADPTTGAYQAVLLQPGCVVGRLDLTLQRGESGVSLVAGLVISALGAAGNGLLDDGAEARLGRWLSELLVRVRETAPRPIAVPVAPPLTVSAQTATEVTGDLDAWFALACPVAELDWLDDWHFDLLHNHSGHNEDDGIFQECATPIAVFRLPNGVNTWYTTVWDPEHRFFQAVQLMDDRIAGLWELRLESLGNRRARWSVDLRYSALSPEGDQILAEAGVARRMEEMLAFITASAEHYMGTGRILRLGHHRKLSLVLGLLSSTVGRHWRQLRPAAG